MKPFVKWAGGKRQILDRVIDYIEDSKVNDNYTYIEPFLGGGAVFFGLEPKNAIINDINSDLINAYEVIKSDDYTELIKLLKKHKEHYSDDENRSEYYYEVRELDRKPDFQSLSKVERAARMIFINKTCYNGLYRVNSKNQFNTPIGRYKNPLICDESNIKEIHNYLSANNNIQIFNVSYEKIIKMAKADDIIYLDPPYDYKDDDGFTKYQMAGFDFEDFKKLKECCDEALAKGVYIIISNNATEKVLNLFKQDSHYKLFYFEDKFTTLRSICCDGTNRKSGEEVIIWGIPNKIPLPQADDIQKIIKLLKCDDNLFSNREYLLKLLNVKANRQVSYYISALSYLGLIGIDHKFNEKAKEIINSNNINLSLAKHILDLSPFSELLKLYKTYNCELPDEIISNTINKDNKYSESTINRRIQTIKSWFNWAIQFL